MSGMLAVVYIRLDGGTQPRGQIDEALVSEYADAMKGGATFPPITVFHDGVDYWLADGFHRVLAARRAFIASIPAEVQQGTKRDAVLFSVGANASHGLRRTNADKRKAVMTLLNDSEWSQWSDREIARRCGVSDRFVNGLRPSVSANDSQIETRKVERNGTVYEQNTANIGKAARGADEPPERLKRKGVGLRYAHEAIAVLKKIPRSDGLRGDAFDTVIDWINTNRED